MDEGNIACQNCQREVDDSLTWCPFCGTELEPGAAGRHQDDSATTIAAAPDAGDEGADPFAPTTSRGALPADSISYTSTTGAGPTGGLNPAVKVTIGAALLALIGAGAAFFFLSSSDTGDLAVDRMSVGDCWNDPDIGPEATEVFVVPQVPCDEPHANEVFAVVDIPAGSSAPYPGEFATYLEGFQMCLDRFEAYVGVPFRESPLDIYSLYPIATGWAAGDREVVCSLYSLDEVPLVGTEMGSDRRLSSPALDPSGIGDCSGLAAATLVLTQDYIDYFDGLTDDLMPLIKGEALIIARADSLGCSFDDLNAMVGARAGALTSTTDLGRSVIEDIVESGFFATG
jgi:hypothetical protein